MTQDLAISFGGLEAKCSNLPSGAQNSTTPCSLWYGLGPGSSLAISPVHTATDLKHPPAGTQVLLELGPQTHHCKEPHEGCSTGYGSRIRRARVVQTQLTAQAKPRRLSSTSQGALVPPPQTGSTAQSLGDSGEQGSAPPLCWKINQQSLFTESSVLTIKQLWTNA